MMVRMMKYNPAFLTEEELIEGFAVRQAELESILEVVRENGGDSNQHILIVGPRGIGKTTLVLRAAAAIKRDSELKEKWYPLVYGEESYQVGSAGEFWLEGLFHLAEQTKEERWQKTYEDLKTEKDEGRLRERALGQLMEFAAEQKKRLILIVENMGMLLGDQIKEDDEWAIRHTLQNEKRVMVLGTAIRRFEEIEGVDKAMFELFKVLELRPLDTKECKALWKKMTGEKTTIQKIRPIEILTGGNPRLLAIIINFAIKTSFKQLMEDLTQLIDEHTEYFKGHLDRFAPVERKVFVGLADHWDPATAREIGQEARLEVSKTSSFLNRLVERGAVTVADKKGRTKKYQLAERLYNIYHLMRRSGNQTSRIEVVVKFMIRFYEREELLQAMKSIIFEANELGENKRKDHLRAIEILIKNLDKELKERLINMMPNSLIFTSGVPFIIPESALEIQEEKIRTLETKTNMINKSTAFMKKMLEIIRKSEQNKWIEIAKNEVDNEPKSSDAWFFFGLILKRFGLYDEAENAYRKSIDCEPNYADSAWLELICFLVKDKKEPEDALKVIDNYLKQMNRSAESLNDLVKKFYKFKLEDYYDRAEFWSREAVEKDSKDLDYKHTLASILGRRGKWEEAWGLAAEFLGDREWVEKWMEEVIGFFVAAAAAGEGERGLGVLRGSASEGALEPLVVGLQMYVGEEVLKAQEIMEIGKDVVERIKQRRRERDGSKE